MIGNDAIPVPIVNIDSGLSDLTNFDSCLLHNVHSIRGRQDQAASISIIRTKL
jgi:hypothetical protein